MTTAQIITLILAVSAHVGWIQAFLHSVNTRSMLKASTPPKP